MHGGGVGGGGGVTAGVALPQTWLREVLEKVRNETFSNSRVL